MNKHYDSLARAALFNSESVGSGTKCVEDALIDVERNVADAFQSIGTLALWQTTQKEIAVLSILYPHLHDLLGPEDDASPFSQRTTHFVTEEIALKLITRGILRGVKLLDENPNCRAGAAMIMDACPSPIPPPSHPFEDPPGYWEHTEALD